MRPLCQQENKDNVDDTKEISDTIYIGSTKIAADLDIVEKATPVPTPCE